ncbi:MAG: ArsI/CadI family heavy metal resistance metalloenzyme [Candidatus Binataceae bacterium]
MKRFHVHVAVENLADSITFYSDLFGAKPTVERPDYAKWLLEDPRVNFAISSRGHKAGVNHLGFQAEDEAELAQLGERANRASGAAVLKDSGAECCYAKSDKYWVLDPQGLAWEHFHTLGEVPIFGEDSAITHTAGQEACCIPLYQNKSPTDEKSEGACCVPRRSQSSESVANQK